MEESDGGKRETNDVSIGDSDRVEGTDPNVQIYDVAKIDKIDIPRSLSPALSQSSNAQTNITQSEQLTQYQLEIKEHFKKEAELKKDLMNGQGRIDEHGFQLFNLKQDL